MFLCASLFTRTRVFQNIKNPPGPYMSMCWIVCIFTFISSCSSRTRAFWHRATERSEGAQYWFFFFSLIFTFFFSLVLSFLLCFLFHFFFLQGHDHCIHHYMVHYIPSDQVLKLSIHAWFTKRHYMHYIYHYMTITKCITWSITIKHGDKKPAPWGRRLFYDQ